MRIQDIAVVCHEANKTLCESLGDTSQVSWPFAKGWQRQSAIEGVNFRIANPDAPESQQHETWMADKLAAGWKLGPEKNENTKEHPCLVPYDQLPAGQKAKDALFVAIVNALKPLLDNA